jgi:hypothetical protein
MLLHQQPSNLICDVSLGTNALMDPRRKRSCPFDSPLSEADALSKSLSPHHRWRPAPAPRTQKACLARSHFCSSPPTLLSRVRLAVLAEPGAACVRSRNIRLILALSKSTRTAFSLSRPPKKRLGKGTYFWRRMSDSFGCHRVRWYSRCSRRFQCGPVAVGFTPPLFT